MIVFSDRLTLVQLEEAADFLNHKCPFVNAVELVIQLGSGLLPDGLFDEEWSRFPLQHMPHMPNEASRARHPLEVIWGTIGQTKVLLFSGRYHLYEGYGRIPCVLPVWAAAHCGARAFLLTNAAGAVNPELKVGSFMAMTDHINNQGMSALSGHQHLLRDSFVDMGDVYAPDLRRSLRATAGRLGVELGSGVYLANIGPQFETPAEVRVARTLGADAVGMSTVMEATVARAMGAKVLGLSLITNAAAGMTENGVITHEEHVSIGRQASQMLVTLVREWLEEHSAELL